MSTPSDIPSAKCSIFFSFVPDFPGAFQRTELVKTENEDWLVDLESEDLRLNERKRASVDLDETLSLLAVCDCGRGLLLAEALYALCSRGHIGGCESTRGVNTGRSWSRYALRFFATV